MALQLTRRGAARSAALSPLRPLLLLAAGSVFCFLLITLSPIDPVEYFVGSESGVSAEQRALVASYWHLDKPSPERYRIWLGNILRGDLGMSLIFRRPVIEVIKERFSASLALMFTAWALSGIFGFALGVAAGSRPHSLFDKAVRVFCFVLSSTPVFWIGLVLLMLLSVNLGWFPIGFAAPIGKPSGAVTLADRVYHLALPALTLSITGVASIALHTRQKLIDVMASEYFIFARARGEGLMTAVRRHGLRNIAIPAVTLQFASFSELFGGSVLAENVFSYPGLGNAASLAGTRGDAALFLGIALFSVMFVFAGNAAANALYRLFDPRLRGGYGH